MAQMIYYRVVEICKAYDSYFGEGKGWIYCSNGFLDYYTAIRYAIKRDEAFPWNKTWVEANYMDHTEFCSVPSYWWHEDSRLNIY
jgi:hypothetical protein